VLDDSGSGESRVNQYDIVSVESGRNLYTCQALNDKLSEKNKGKFFGVTPVLLT
jgi:hypothetical protein